MLGMLKVNLSYDIKGLEKSSSDGGPYWKDEMAGFNIW